jgi:hypothetical protein
MTFWWETGTIVNTPFLRFHGNGTQFCQADSDFTPFIFRLF